MLFQQQFERLYFAVERIAGQLEYADEQQRRYLCEELGALRKMGSQFLDLWISFEDRVSDLTEKYSVADAGLPPFSPEAALKNENPAGAFATDGSGQTAFVPGSGLAEADVRPPSAWPDGPASLLDTADGLRLFRKGIGYFDLFMFDESKRAFARILELDPQLAVARLYLALCHLSGGEEKEAERQLSLVEWSTDDELLIIAAREAKAQIHVAGGRFLEAAKELLRVLQARPDYSDAQFNAALCFYALGDHRRAAEHARRAIELSPADAQAWRVYGAAQFEAARSAGAIKAYRQALILSPHAPDILCETAYVLRYSGHFDEADGLYRRALTIRATDTRAMAGLAWIALERKEHTQAVGLLKKAVCLEPHNEERLGQLGYALCLDGRLEEAERLFQSLLKQSSQPLLPLSGLARVAALRGEARQAVAYLRRVMDLGDDRSKVHGLTELARLFAHQGRWRRSLRCLAAALSIDRSDRDALVFLGIVMRASGIESADRLLNSGMIP